jgi:hypothetical protein
VRKLTELQWKKIRKSGGSSIKTGYRAFKHTAYAVVFVDKDMIIRSASIYSEPHPTANLRYFSVVVDDMTANSFSQAVYKLRYKLKNAGHWVLQFMPGGLCVDEIVSLPEDLRAPAKEYFKSLDNLKRERT